MRLAIYSDLHLEMILRPKGSMPWLPPALDVDVVVLAGDIASGTYGIRWAAEAFCQGNASPEVIYVAGNHEYYGENLRSLLAEMRWTAKKLGVHFLENNTVELGDVRFLGTTLWSDFELYGRGLAKTMHMKAARQQISDYSTIFAAGERFIEPQETLRLHRNARKFLKQELKKPYSGKTVVVTHFAPHRGCVPQQFAGSVLSPYFVSDMASIMRQHPIDLWVVGHTHHNIDLIESRCRVISNQMGYPLEQCAKFNKDLIIEL